MIDKKRKTQRTVLIIAVSAALLLGSSFMPPAAANKDTGLVLQKRAVPRILVQAKPGETGASDATSAATGSSETTEAGSVEAVSAASDENAPKDKEYCLKCHGPFEKLAERTKGYVTEWDEKANPHVYVRHDTKNITECTECHDVHAIPIDPAVPVKKANVSYCYSCHHAETLVKCTQCHNE
jgi:hypothetical protein